MLTKTYSSKCALTEGFADPVLSNLFRNLNILLYL